MKSEEGKIWGWCGVRLQISIVNQSQHSNFYLKFEHGKLGHQMDKTLPTKRIIWTNHFNAVLGKFCLKELSKISEVGGRGGFRGWELFPSNTD